MPSGAKGVAERLVTNLKCYCRTHHLVKTFWGWRDRQLPDGTVILDSPAGKTYVTTTGSALLFPSLCTPTRDLRPTQPTAPLDYCGERTAMMPKRARTEQRTALNASTPNADKTARPARASEPKPSATSDQPHHTPTTTHHRSNTASP